MNWMIMLAQLLLSLSFLVAVHEMGHLLAAKYFGMRVEQFSIGFPPKLWSFKKGETEYAISAIPLGGYVKISGMIDESLDTEAMKAEPQPWEFRSKPAWQRLIVMLGGIVVNVVVGVLIFIGITFVYGDTYLLKDAINQNGGFQVGPIGESIGLKTGDKIIEVNGKNFDYLEEIVKPETLLSTGSYTVERNGERIVLPIPANFIEQFSSKVSPGSFVSFRFEPVIGEVEKETIAEKVKLQEGDKIVEINGTPIQYYDQVTPLVKSSGDSIAFKVSRAGSILAFKERFIERKADEDDEDDVKKDNKAIGFYPMKPKAFFDQAEHRITYSFVSSIPKGTERAFTSIFTQIKAFGKMISGKISPKKSLSGPLGIMMAFGSDWEWERFWWLTGVLSLVLAFMNLLPIPALDGGHVMFLSYEMISRRKPSDKFLEMAQKVGMVLLLALMVFVFANDIVKWFEK